MKKVASLRISEQPVPLAILQRENYWQSIQQLLLGHVWAIASNHLEIILKINRKAKLIFVRAHINNTHNDNIIYIYSALHYFLVFNQYDSIIDVVYKIKMRNKLGRNYNMLDMNRFCSTILSFNGMNSGIWLTQDLVAQTSVAWNSCCRFW